MIAAYAVILAGGLLITARLELLAAAATFWITLAAGIGVLAASGHCMIARWAFAPVCGFDFWRVIVTSPEVLIFLFFMITDPKTVPSGRVGRVVFGFLVAVASTLLMAPQTNEFGTKVALLGGLVVVCACSSDPRPAGPRSTRSTSDGLARGWRPVRRAGAAMPRLAVRVGLVLAVVAVVGAAHRRRRRSGSRCRRPGGRRRAGPRAPRRRPGHVPVDLRRAGRPGLEPRDHRTGRARDRPDPGREPPAREPGAAPRRPRRSSRPSTTATASTRCAIGSRTGEASGAIRRRALPDRRRARHPARPVRPAGRPEPRPGVARRR